MESFATLIQNRRSTRKFTEQLLSPEQVELILKAALMAPASKRSNPWQFVVVEDKEMLKKLAGCKKNGSAFLEGLCLGRGCLGECDGKRCLDRGRFGRFYLYAIAGGGFGIGQLLVSDPER